MRASARGLPHAIKLLKESKLADIPDLGWPENFRMIWRIFPGQTWRQDWVTQHYPDHSLTLPSLGVHLGWGWKNALLQKFSMHFFSHFFSSPYSRASQNQVRLGVGVFISSVWMDYVRDVRHQARVCCAVLDTRVSVVTVSHPIATWTQLSCRKYHTSDYLPVHFRNPGRHHPHHLIYLLNKWLVLT